MRHLVCWIQIGTDDAAMNAACTFDLKHARRWHLTPRIEGLMLDPEGSSQFGETPSTLRCLFDNIEHAVE